MKVKLISFISVLAVCFFSVSCSTDTVWGIDTETFAASIRHGDIGFLRHIEYSEVELSEIYRLGPGAALSAAYIFDRLGMEEMALDMLRLGWEEGIGLWRMHAGEEFIGRLLNNKEYDSAERAAELYSREYSGRYFGRRAYLEALYWQQKDREALHVLEDLKQLFPERAAADGELSLFAAVLSSRLELTGWDDLFVEMFQGIPSSGVLIRGYKYVTGSDRLREYFAEDELALFNARVLTATGRHAEAAEVYAVLLGKMSPVIYSEKVYEEIGTVFLGSPLQPEGGRLLLAHTAGQPFFYGYFSAGRLLRAEGRYSRAYELFLTASKHAGDNMLLYERSVWYGLDCLLQQGVELFVENLPEAAKRWHNPGYYSDLLEDAAAELTSRRQWDLVWDVFRTLRSSGGGPEALALYGHILLQAENAGLFQFPYDQQVPDAGTLRKAVSGYHSYGYYHLLNLSPEGKLPPALSAAGEEGVGGEEELEGGSGKEAEFVRSFASYSLLEKMYGYALRYEDRLSNTDLLRTAELLSGAELFREAITLVNRGIRRGSWLWTRDALQLLFPKAFAHTIENAARENGIDLWLLTALIREESYFDPDAVSHAGAVGLSQLMPGTAAETARRMGIANPDITNPEDNVAMGAFYFASLLRRFDGNPLYAVCAYNAGPTRMRRWAAEYGKLPMPLLIEAIPIDETRNHAKKVLVSMLLYGYLYGSREIQESIQYYVTGQQQ